MNDPASPGAKPTISTPQHGGALEPTPAEYDRLGVLAREIVNGSHAPLTTENDPRVAEVRVEVVEEFKAELLNGATREAAFVTVRDRRCPGWTNSLLSASTQEPTDPMDRQVEAFKALRLQGASEAKALETTPDGLKEALSARGLLDEWPIGWTETESAKLAQYLTFDDVVGRLARVVDLPREKLVLGVLLSAQGHLSHLLRAIGPAIHVVAENPRYSAGKTRCVHALTILADGRWTDSATVPYLRSARKDGPKVLGIDEGDEAENDSPGVKAYLLISHNWDAIHGKFSDPNEKGQRDPEDIPYGGPVFVTFRKKPWPQIESRSIVFSIERSKKTSVSDDGAGDGLCRLLLAPMLWLKVRCVEGSKEWTPQRALARIHEPEFVKLLDKVTKTLAILRQRDKARTLLFIAERLGIGSEEIEAALREEEIESENEAIIEAIERDPKFLDAQRAGPEAEVPVEELRLRVQKELRDHGELRTLTRNRFAAVLQEMEFSKHEGPTWKEGKGKGRPAVILPGLWAKVGAPSAPSPPTPSRENGGTGGTGGTTLEGFGASQEDRPASGPDQADHPAETGSWQEGPVHESKGADP